MSKPLQQSPVQDSSVWTNRLRSWAGPKAAMLVLMVLTLSVGIAAWGVMRHAAELGPVWHPDGRTAVIWAGLVMAAWTILGSLFRLPPRLIVLALPFLASLSAMGIGPVAAALLIFSSATQTGLLLLPDPGDERNPPLLMAVAAATGLAVFALLLQASSQIVMHYQFVYLALLALPFAFMPMRVRRGWMEGWNTLRAKPQPALNAWNALLWTIAIAGALIRLLGVFAPEAGMDALGMHLQMPAMIARDHVWSPATTGFVWAWMPMAVDWIYTVAYSLAGEPAARLVNYGADMLILMGCAGAAKFMGGARAAALAAALYSTLPLTYLVTTSLFVENLLMLWTGMALVAASWLRGGSGGRRGHVVLGLLIGAALASKLMTFFWAPLFAVFAYQRIRVSGMQGVRMLVWSLVAALLVGAWPYSIAWLETGNPVFPFMNALFKSPLFDSTSSFASNFVEPLRWTLLYDITFHTSRFIEAPAGGFGVLWLAVMPAGLLAVMAWGNGWLRWLAAGAALFVLLTLAFTSNLRYVMPALPVLSVLAAIGFGRAQAMYLQHAAAVVVMLGGAAGLALFANSTWFYRALPPKGPVDPAAYVRWQKVMRPEADLVRRANELGLKNVLWLGRTFYAGLQARVTSDSWHQESGWRQISDQVGFDRWMSQHEFDGLVLTPGVDACVKPWLCDFVAGLGAAELETRGARLYLISSDQASIFENLRDAELHGGDNAWSGNGAWDKQAGIMRVNATRVFTQRVPVQPRRAYLYSVKVRCHAGSALFRMQVDFLMRAGTLVSRVSKPDLCSTDWREHSIRVVVPQGASEAVVYAAGQSADRDIEIDRASFHR